MHQMRTLLLAVAAVMLQAAAAQKQILPTCPSGVPALESNRPPPLEQSVFDELTGDELVAVRDFLLAQPELGLVRLGEAGPTDNVVFVIELLPPPKADVLAHLDHGGPKPQRRAYAVLLLYSHPDGPRCMQVEVGPLPSPTYYKELIYPKQAHPIDILSRPISDPEYDGQEAVVVAFMKEVEEVVAEATGGWSYDEDTCGHKCLTWTDNAPRGGKVAGGRKNWLWFLRNVDGLYIHHIGLEIYIDCTSLNASEWHVDAIQWANKLWNNTAEIMEWWTANGNTSAGYRLYDPSAQDLIWSSFKQRDPKTPRGERRGAAHYEPTGKRYTVSGKRVSWQGWDFSVGLRTTAGMRLSDIRFKGERVAYELSVQQAAAAYGGNPDTSPMQAITFYLDHAWGMGSSHFELLAGADCPSTAVFFDFWHYWSADAPSKNLNSICMFEMDLGYPLRRHRSGPGGWAASIRGYALVVRGISTVYNYDYAYEFLFYSDGTLEVKVTPFGYIQGVTYTMSKDSQDSYPMWYNASGTIHSHHVQWKVDLDIGGTSNSVRRDRVESMLVDTPWHAVKQQWSARLASSFLESEDEGLIKVDMNKPTQTAVVSETAKNKWGSMRGYKIDISKYIYNLFPDDTLWMPAARWTQSHMMFTVHKDDELTGGTIFDQSTPTETILDCTQYADGESLRNQDLVAWVSSGLWHLPVSEDGPTSSGTAHYVGFVLRPYNYFDEDPAMDTREIMMYRVNEEGTGSNKVPNTMLPSPPCAPRDNRLPFTGVPVDYVEPEEDDSP